jgi:hypothetical protein
MIKKPKAEVRAQPLKEPTADVSKALSRAFSEKKERAL